jgi:hypothetical protein
MAVELAQLRGAVRNVVIADLSVSPAEGLAWSKRGERVSCATAFWRHKLPVRARTVILTS